MLGTFTSGQQPGFSVVIYTEMRTAMEAGFHPAKSLLPLLVKSPQDLGVLKYSGVFFGAAKLRVPVSPAKICTHQANLYFWKEFSPPPPNPFACEKSCITFWILSLRRPLKYFLLRETQVSRCVLTHALLLANRLFFGVPVRGYCEWSSVCMSPSGAL